MGAEIGNKAVPSLLQPLTCPAHMTAKDFIQKVWQENALNPDGSRAV